jgi:hypothetical protein
LPVGNVLATPSFEIYSSTSYPTITPVLADFEDNDLVVMVSAEDVSGISLISAKIIDSSGNEVESKLMLNDGNPPDASSSDSIYSITISNVKAYTPGAYHVEILALDNLNIYPPENMIVGNFVIEQVVLETCVTNNGTQICAVISTLSNSDQISAPVINPASVVAGASTAITATFKTATSGKQITFKDITDNIVIGSTITASGVASISYATLLLATVGSHTISAEYAGGLSDNPSYKTAILSVTSPGICSTSFGATICTAIEVTLTNY